MIGKRIPDLFAGVVSLVLFAVVSAFAGSEPSVEVTDKVQIHETVVNGFVHPGIGLNKEMLEDLRAQVSAKRDPWYSGFLKLASSSRSAKNISIANQSKADPARPELDAFQNASVEGRLKTDSDTALHQVMMYWFTGEEIYRANAMRIVRLWSKMDPEKFKAYNEVYIHCSYAFKDMILVAELLRGMDSPNPELAWTEQDTVDFSNNYVTPGVINFFNFNGWFMNQNGFAYVPAIAGAIFKSDPQDYALRVERFTVNKDGPNKGSSFSIQDLARLVDTNALTGEKVATPQVQLTEMGRDQAHAGEDLRIFATICRILNSQGTKVDPVVGTPSKAPGAVGPYEFLNDRILAATDHFCRFMLGFDTPWIPTPSNIAEDGTVRQIYSRIADNYRGRIRQHRMWDLYYYYTCKKGVDLSKKAPYFHETFLRRIVSDDFDWLYIPTEASGDALRIPPSEQEPAVVEVELRSANLTENSSVQSDGEVTFVRVTASPEGTRLSILSCATESKTVGLRIRTTGVAEVEMSGFGKPWLLPNTQGEWRQVFYTMSPLERFGDIVFFNIKGAAGTTVDLDQMLRKPDEQPPVFASGDAPLSLVAYVGASIRLDFSAAGNGGGTAITYRSLDKPEDAVLDPKTGSFSWNPAKIEDRVFVVEATDGDTVAPKKISISVVADRAAALEAIKTGYDASMVYVEASVERCKSCFARAQNKLKSASDAEFFSLLVELKAAFDALEPLTPLLPDGSMDFPGVVVSCNIGAEAMNLLVDGNDDTFVGFYLAKDRRYDFDFGPDFKFSATAFAMEGRVNFEDRMEGVKFYGSNDENTWTELTPEATPLATELSRVEVADNLTDSTFRFLRVQKLRGWGIESSEMRIHGKRHESGNKLESISLGSEKSNGLRVPLGETVRLTIQAREPINNLRVRIQGIQATVRNVGGSTYVAEAVMRPSQAKPGPVEFSVDYQGKDGKPCDTAYVTTDGSRLLLIDESDLIRNVQKTAEIIDPNTGKVSANSQRMLDSLFDNNPDTFTELRLNSDGAGAYLWFDFGQGRSVRLSGVELLARPKYRDRIGGAVVQGSDDGKTWTTLTKEAINTEDWQRPEMEKAGGTYRYIRIFNRNTWYCNVSEVRFHGVEVGRNAGKSRSPLDRGFTIHMDQPGAAVSPTLYGAFFEDINRAGDGGLYAEMVQNRSFEDNEHLIAWTPEMDSKAVATFDLDRSAPLNANNPTSLKIHIGKTGGERVAVFNQGFKGIISPKKAPETSEAWVEKFAEAQRKPGNGLVVEAGKEYRFSMYVRAQGHSGGIGVSLETQSGKVLARQEVGNVGRDWDKIELVLSPGTSDADARLVVSFDEPGTVWLDMVSLFPADTWKNRGLRPDLAQMMADMKPGLFRFPGGSYSEGAVLAHAWRWKETIGDVAERRGTWNIWGYRSTSGLGYHEYLQLAEDLGAEPLYVAHVGMAERDFVPMDQLEPWIQDVLDAIEYANGPVTSKWGALRAKNGHPEPFNLKYVEIGNENGMGYSWGGGTRADYLPRYQAFYERIKAAYPDIVAIANIHTEPDVPADLIDEHYYETADWFFKAATLYDDYDRSKPKIYVGEYAVKKGAGRGNMEAALGEAAFLTGLERNADVVEMSSYAPLYTNPYWQKWQPDAIVFDNTRVYGTPSYYVQKLFANNRPDVVLPVTLPESKDEVPLLFACAGLQRGSGDLILKVVNRGEKPQRLNISSAGPTGRFSKGVCTELSAGSLMDENSFEQPDKIAPKVGAIQGGSHVFPAYSVTILRWQKGTD